ncbi:MAG: hypothetical protein OXL39_14600 [Caldilineaceae bacterium]|nr:hypothetical protein [Caldilineaceae bacterium]MDE0071076.1 hypothetical protein [Caldilineaceae bacterium]MDE0182577.1 hypothetical protein [Caldilineaceae bacterium]
MAKSEKSEAESKRCSLYRFDPLGVIRLVRPRCVTPKESSRSPLSELIRLLRPGPWEGKISGSLANNFPKLLNERRQIIDNCLAHQNEIYGLVIVNQPVAHSDHVTPWNLRVFAPRLIGHIIGGLAHNFNQLYKGELHHFIPFQRFLACRTQHFYRFDGINTHGNKTYSVIICVHTGARLNRLSPL